VTALKAAEVAGPATTVVRRAIASKTAPTLVRSLVATVTRRAMRAVNARFRGITLESSAPTARRWATPRSDARSPSLRRTTTLLTAVSPAMLEVILVPLVVLAAMVELHLVVTTGVPQELKLVVLLFRAGKFLPSFDLSPSIVSSTAIDLMSGFLGDWFL
jgi:hypothetical protein